jgi:hypothetical protein
MGVHVIGVHVIVVPPIGVHSMGVPLIDVPLMMPSDRRASHGVPLLAEECGCVIDVDVCAAPASVNERDLA